MSITLFHHNAEAYEAALFMLKHEGKAAIVHPTGTGKSFIAFKLCEDNPDKTVCWLSPSEYIFETQLENLAEVSDGYQPTNIVFYTYAKLMNMTKEQMGEIKPDYIVLDEFHRCGAEMWGQGVDMLLSLYAGVPILGLSATAIRYLDNQRDMSDELFDGNIASEITLGEAIVRGILNPPKYVLSVFSYQKGLEKYAERVHHAKSKAVRIKAEQDLEALRRALEKADGLDVIFDKHMEDRHGKYIVFCSNVEHLYEMRELAEDWFRKVDAEAHFYVAYADNPETDKAFAAFKKDTSDHLKLLFCVDMLNEGVHVEDISGVILLRPTVSPIIYKQQIGRALSASKKGNAVIFDIVMNIENLYSIGAIEEEMQIATSYYRMTGENKEIVNEHFKIIDEVKDCITLFHQLQESLTASWDLMYEYAKSYFAAHGNLDVPKRFQTAEGYALGSWINTQRLVHDGKAKGVLTDGQVKKLTAIGMRWETVRDIAWEKNYAAAKAYFEEYGNLLVSTSDIRYHGVALGRWLSSLRINRKCNIQSAYMTEERIQALDKIGMVWDVPNYVWETHYHAAVLYHQEHGNLDVPGFYVTKDGIKLGAWLTTLRNADKKEKLTDLQIAKLNELGFVWKKRKNITWDKSYLAACEYKKEYGNLEVPVSYVTPDGCQLGRWIRHQKDTYGKTMSTARQAKIKKLGLCRDADTPWEDCFAVVKDYYETHGNLHVPTTLQVNGTSVLEWIAEQTELLNTMAAGKISHVKLTKEQIKKLKSVGICQTVSKSEMAWTEQYGYAVNFYQTNGHLQVPRRYIAPNGKNLGAWVLNQRKKYQEGLLSEKQITLLNQIGMSWQSEFELRWDSAYDQAYRYYKENGDALIPYAYKCADGFDLGVWLDKQKKDEEKLNQTQKEKLQLIGAI